MPWTRALVGLVALAIFAPAAKANLYCVNTASCAGGTVETDFQQALNDAQIHSGADTVQLGPGTFPSSFGFSYSGSDPVTITGAGTGATTVSDSGANPGTNVLTIAGSTASTVSDLKLVNEGTLMLGNPFPAALKTVGSANDIEVEALPSSSNVNGIAAGPASVISHVNVAVPLNGGSSFNEGVETSPGTVLEDSTIQGDVAVNVFGTGSAATLRRLTIRSDFEPVVADTASTVSLQDSLILSVGTDPAGLVVSHDPPNITADNVTMIGPGTPASTALVAHSGGSITFRNSIAVGYGTTFNTDSTSSISTDYSDDPGTRAGTGTITEAHQLNVDPGFVNASAGDYRLAAGSPLIDAGDPAGPAVGDSPTDLAGNSRVVGGRLDIGAYEFQPPPPVTKDTTPPAFSSVSETNKVFAVGKASTPVTAKKKPKVGTTFRYTLSEASKVKLVIAQKLPGRRVGKSCRNPSRRKRGKRCTRFVKRGTLTRNGTAGRNSVKFSGRIGRRALKPGRYRVTLTATDAAGNVSKPAALSFRIVPAAKKHH